MTNGRRIGRAFEQRLARDLRTWLGPDATVQRRRNDQQACAGEFDIHWPAGRFPFAIEAKAHKTFDVAQLWTRQGPMFNGKPESWLEQCERQARDGGLAPLLVINVPRRFVLAVMLPGDFDRLNVPALPEMDLGDHVAILWDDLMAAPADSMLRMETP